jgi:class 3 adenylate cyclase
MFLDICRFSARASETETEQDNNLRVLSFFFAELIRIIEDYGGVVEKNTGDGLMAYFTREASDAETAGHKALACALTIFHAATHKLNPIIALELIPLDFRICIDCGFITVADVGAARRFRGMVAIGTTANVASKMLKVAGKSEILLGENVVNEIPSDWVRQFVILKLENTGWNYVKSGALYRFFLYNGRWKTPTE